MIVRLLAVFSLALLAGCSVDAARNTSERCTTDGECASGTCHRGFCVTGGGGLDTGTDAGIDSGGSPGDGGDAGADAGSDTGSDASVAIDADIDAATITPCSSDTDCGDDGDPCNGTERCVLPDGSADGHCDFGMAQVDGVLCDRDGTMATRDLCVGHVCSQTRCGDGYFDVVNMEVCDDGNALLGDGCDDCRYSCTMNSACLDTNECNGMELCDMSVHACRSGTALGEGDPCRGSRGTCTAGECVANSCATNADCDDLDECNGVETCNTTTTLCMSGAPPDCGDGNACTVDTCTRGLGCAHALMDADHDGFAPRSCAGPTGDCDDSDPTSYPGAPEICGDGIDNNCSGDTTDENDFWYADCDADGYALMGAQIGHSCSGPPMMAPVVCLAGGWTAREPTTSALTRDCNDGNALVHPGQTAYQTTAISGAPAAVDFDYDCDGVETRRTTTAGVCSGTLGLCSLSQGWFGGVPACGADAEWILTCAGLGCTRGAESRTQGCL